MMVNKSENRKKEIELLQTAPDLTAIVCDSTRLPYVECDIETCDDQVLVYENREMAEKEAKKIEDAGYRVRTAHLPQKQRFGFFANLYSLGVNAVLINKGEESQVRLDLDKVINRPDIPRFTYEIRKALDAGEKPKFRVENPEFHLTAIYFTQLSRGTKAQEHEEELKELQEEMMTHYREGYYIVARTKEGTPPLLKTKDGGSLQPMFSDMQEFLKFQHVNPTMKVETAVMTEAEFLKHLAKEATGVVINPLGISLLLQVNRKKSD